MFTLLQPSSKCINAVKEFGNINRYGKQPKGFFAEPIVLKFRTRPRHCPLPAPAFFLPFLTRFHGLTQLTGMGPLAMWAARPRPRALPCSPEGLWVGKSNSDCCISGWPGRGIPCTW